MFLFRETLPKLNCHIRFFHAAPGAPELDIYIDGRRASRNLAFSTMTSYSDFYPGEHEVKIFTRGTTEKALYIEKVNLPPTSTQTFSAVLLESTLTIFSLKDAGPQAESELSFIRFINFSPDAPLLSLGLPNGNTLFNGVEYLETTGYYPIRGGIYDFELSATGASVFRKFLKSIKIEPGKFHTIFIIGLFHGNPRLGSYVSNDGVNRLPSEMSPSSNTNTNTNTNTMNMP